MLTPIGYQQAGLKTAVTNLPQTPPRTKQANAPQNNRTVLLCPNLELKDHSTKVMQLNTCKIRRLYPFPPHRFHVLFNSLFKVLCNFPSQYLFAIGLVAILSLR